MESFYELSEMLSRAVTEDQIKQVCKLFCEAVGFEYSIYVVWCATSLSAPKLHCLSNYPEKWFKQYFAEGLQKHDPIVKYCFENLTPICWDQLMSMEKYLNPIGVEVMQRAAEYGLVNGFSIPLKSPCGDVAIFSLATDSNEQIEERILEVLPYGQLFGLKLHEVHTKLNNGLIDAKSYRLTERETECLFWACEGKTTWEISKIIEVTERTIVFHLSSAMKKLGAVNRQHAVAKAIMQGLIKPTP